MNAEVSEVRCTCGGCPATARGSRSRMGRCRIGTGRAIARQTAAKAAAAAGRLPDRERQLLARSRGLVDRVAMWCSAVGTWLGGSDTTHGKVKQQRALPERRAAAVQ
eukprot:7576561-Pyramimonas_sp.AAC.1